MTTDETIGTNGFAMTVEMGDDFVPGPRTAAALAELVNALHEEHGPETSGYSFESPHIRNVAFVAPGDGSVATYNTFEAWPSKWKGFSLDGKGTDV